MLLLLPSYHKINQVNNYKLIVIKERTKAMENRTELAPIAVNIKELQSMLGVSKNTAMDIAKRSNAVVNLGIRRTLYNVQAVKDYIDSRTGVE